MNKVYENQQKVHLMFWETNPRLRNDNNIIKVNSSVDLKSGDVILGALLKDISISEYTISEIIDSRPSTLSHHTYYTLKTTFKYASASTYLNKVSSKLHHRIDHMIKAKEEEDKKKKTYHNKKSA